ncbi:protein lifeguard 1-like [Hetaerina americana]|uniref:protein lifeguard 1-like n=1 Tax=Hetaerina americana TaxID=62018 RepID=UPI003A7F619A
MTTWQQQPPTMGFYPPPQGNQGYYPPNAGGYPPNAGGYPPNASGYPQNAGGYPQPGIYPGQSYPGGVPAGMMGPGQAPYAAPMPAHPAPEYDEDYKNETPLGNSDFQFSSKTIRHAFIRKVYCILMCQLLVTVGFILLFMFHMPTKMYVRQHPSMMYVAYGVFLVVLIALSCCESVRRKYPTNFICLVILTFAMSYMMGTMAAFYDTQAVLMAAGITAIVCFSLSVFAFQTKWDFTIMSGALLAAMVVFLIFGIICIFIPGKAMLLVYCSIGVLLMSVYLVYDTQLMMGGNHKFSISPEDYIFAAVSLYLDIVYIFMYILQIIGLSRD